MTDDTHAASPHGGRRSRWLRALVQSAVSALLAPARVASSLAARQRARARLRLTDGSPDTAPRRPSAPSPFTEPRCAPHVVGSSGGSSARTGVAKRDPRFSTVRVDPEFSPRAYAATFAALQRGPSAQLLDLAPARLLCSDVFERLADAWTVSADLVPRLGIVLSFDRWVLLRNTALAALQPLAARGVRVDVFYAEQASGGHLSAWFAYGQVVHNVPAVVATLAARWQPASSWQLVLNELLQLVRANTSTTELPVLLTEIAELALSCGGAEQAAMLAHEALCYLPQKASSTRSKALRELGTALIGQGKTRAGLELLDQAIEMAAAAKAPGVGASALCQSGLHALNHGDYPSAERTFRAAIELLAPTTGRRHLLALAHHHLAIALMHQGKGEAEHHARTALELRPDPDSHLAEQDRILLLKLCEEHAEAN